MQNNAGKNKRINHTLKTQSVSRQIIIIIIIIHFEKKASRDKYIRHVNLKSCE